MSAADFYDRQPSVHVDGSLIFKSAADERAEQEVAAELAASWNCELSSFGRLAPIDWYARRGDRVVGLAELKKRSHASFHYPTVFLNVRKWLALQLGVVGMGVPAVFVVKFTDGVFFVPIAKVDASRIRIAGCGQKRGVESANDVEPVIEVPVSSMVRL